MTNRFLAGAGRFSHLGFMGRGGKRADEDEPRDDEEDGRKGRRSKADDGEDDERDDDKAKKGRRGSRAEDDEKDDDDKEASKGRRGSKADDDGDFDDEDEDEDGAKKSRRSRRSKAEEDDEEADDDDDDDREMRGHSSAAKARRRERSRCAAIFSTAQAAENPALAAHLAFETNMTRQSAIAVLKSQASTGRRRSRDDRDYRRSSQNPDIDTRASEGSRKAVVESAWDNAHKTAAGARGADAWAKAHGRSTK